MATPKTLAFKYLYKAGVVKENTVTVFGELGTVFQKGTDYDEEVQLNVPYTDLSNLILYYTGDVQDGTVGSQDTGSLRNVNAPVTNVKTWQRFTNLAHQNGTNHYYVGDIVLFDPVTGEGTSPNASCWTCVRTTSDLTSPIPDLANEISVATARGDTYNTSYDGPGMTGIDNLGQRYIVGVKPAKINATTGAVVTNPYWRESVIAASYSQSGNYYQGELVVYNGSVYMCKTTDGNIVDPSLFQRPTYTTADETSMNNGVTPSRLVYSLETAPNGAYGYDSAGSRYIMGVPPAGGLFSGNYWTTVTIAKTPSAAYVDINWDNQSIANKFQFYDNNITGGAGAQSIPSFTDDSGNSITTLRKLYDDNEKSFILTNANQILSSIPAAAIKSQSVSGIVQPDSTLVDLVHNGPTNSNPMAYTPAVQGLFEEALARDMLRIGGTKTSITEIVVSDGSSNYTSVPSVNIIGGLTNNPSSNPYPARADAKLGVKSVKINKSSGSGWNSGTRYSVGDAVVFTVSGSASVPTTPARGTVYRVDSNGNILAIQIKSKGSGYSAPPDVYINGSAVPFLRAVMEVVSVDLVQYDVGFGLGKKVTVLGGSGTGAVGYVSSVNGGRITGVSFTPSQGLGFTVSGGSNYISTNFKKDLVLLQGYDDTNSNTVPTARVPAEISSVGPGGVITGVKILKGGLGYTSAPKVVIGKPQTLTEMQGVLGGEGSLISSYLGTVTQPGVYTTEPPVLFGVPSGQTTQDYNAKTYLGVVEADVGLGGSGYSPDEYMNVSGGGLGPSTFSVTPSGNSYNVNVIDGGFGYTIDGTNPAKNEIILDDNTGTGDQIRVSIDALGGAIKTVNFITPSGNGFSVNDVIQIQPADHEGPIRLNVTEIGPAGTIAPQITYTLAADGAYSGYAPGQLLDAVPKYSSIGTLTTNTSLIYPGTMSSTPEVTIPDPGTPSSEFFIPRRATAVPVFRLNGLTITNAGSGYSNGTQITIRQGSAVANAIGLFANSDTGLATVVLSNSTTGFDPSQPLSVTFSPAPTVNAQFSFTYVLDSIRITDPGTGYTGSETGFTITDPTSSSSDQKAGITLIPTFKKYGTTGSGTSIRGTATFIVDAVDIAGAPTVRLFGSGSGYVNGDQVSLNTVDGSTTTATGALYKIDGILSNGIKAATIVSGYAGHDYNTGQQMSVPSTSITRVQGSATALSGFTSLDFIVTKTGLTDAITKVTVKSVKSMTTQYSANTILSHRPHAVVKVATVDTNGSILTLSIESPGYGYKTLPKITPKPSSRGAGASLSAVSLGISRVEFSGGSESADPLANITLSNPALPVSQPGNPAVANAQLSGDLNLIDTDANRNPNILQTLESLKPGSTTGYSIVKPNMGVSSVEVVYAGSGYQQGNSALSNTPLTYVNVQPPDLPGGVAPVFSISGWTSQNGIASISVVSSGSGYSTIPKAEVLLATGETPTLAATIKLHMQLLSGYVTSGGEGFTNAPVVSVSSGDVLNGGTVTGTAKMKTSINGFSIEDTGNQYTSTPNVLVTSAGRGGSATVSMGITDLQIRNAGANYSVGDMLVVPVPTGGSAARITVTGVNSSGAITNVALTECVIENSVVKAISENDNFVAYGGSGYTTIPTISGASKRVTNTSFTGALYNSNGSIAEDEAIGPGGSGASITCTLAVRSINFTNGTGYLCDATVLIQDPPPAQQASYSAIINSLGQFTDYKINSTGTGYDIAPLVSVDGSGTGANAAAIMGVTNVAIADPGRGYRIGDIVNIAGPGGSQNGPKAYVTMIDSGGGGLGFNAILGVRELSNGSLTINSSDGSLTGTYGAIGSSGVEIIDGGFGFEVEDILTFKPETVLPSADTLAGVQVAGNTISVNTDGTLAQIGFISSAFDPSFRAGSVLRVERVIAETGLPYSPPVVAYVRVNTVLDFIKGTGWHSTNGNGQYIEYGSKYGSLIPGFWFNGDGIYCGIPNFVQEAGISGPVFEVLASTTGWTGLLPNSGPAIDPTVSGNRYVNVTIMNPADAYFKVTQVDGNGTILQVAPCLTDGTTEVDGNPVVSGRFFAPFDEYGYSGVPRGRISTVQVIDTGSGYQTAPTVTSITPSTSFVGSGAVLRPMLGVIGLNITSTGSGFLSPPVITIPPPVHRAVTAQAYARSAVFTLESVANFEIVDAGSGYTGIGGTPGSAGSYRIVGGALHQTGSSANSIDTEVSITSDAFNTSGSIISEEALRVNATTTVRGSNYRVGDIVTLVGIGSTTTMSGNIVPRPAKLRVTSVTNVLDYQNSMTNNSQKRTGAGILDYAQTDPATGKDIGGYGAGYYTPPSVRIFGGNQGVLASATLGVTDIDIPKDGGGSGYSVGDIIQITGNGIQTPIDIGAVSVVDSITGAIINVKLYTPLISGLKEKPTIVYKPADATAPQNSSANLQAVLGVTNVTTTASIDGFLGSALVRVDEPTGIGYISQPRIARIVPKMIKEVSSVEISYTGIPDEFVTNVPAISVAPPPNINGFQGWRSVRFNKDDSFEAIVQYTIAKAISFQVDPDASLPGYYFTADSITIGGIVIPLRKSGGKGAQGRELSSNKVIRRYNVKIIAV